MTIIDVQAAHDLLQDPDHSVAVVDVRHPDEFEAGHLEGATLIDVLEDSFADDVSTLDKNAEYLVYCGKGGRSAKAVELMTALGFENLRDLEGGFTAWQDAQLPIAK